MPRNNRCDQCGGMYHDDEMDDSGVCIYCALGVESPVGQPGKESNG